MYCLKCNFENQSDAVFCNSCGSKLEPQQNQPEFAVAESESIASMVMGIISIAAGAIIVVGIILGALAISKGKHARLVLNDHRNHNFWIALVGVITGSVGLAVSIFVAALYFITTIIMIVA